ncbi:MAG: efflux RND transporter periplasmic adaptor subunit [Syntrophobacteria bacterium]|jgi:membrane fusion protein (multidrug efflux system)
MQTTRQEWKTSKGKVLFIGSVLILLLTGCGDKSKEKTAPPPPTVTVTEVAQHKIPIVMEFSGTITSVKTVDIIPRVSGYIEKRYFEEGTFVKEGDPLYLIDPRPFQARLDAHKAQLKSDQASLAYWENEAARYQRLAAQGAASQEKKEGALTKLNETRAAIEKDKADIENARLELSFTRIMAPFSARIQETRINVGNLVQQQRDVLTTLVQMDPIYVIFNLSRNQVYQIQLLKRQGKLFSVEEMKVELLLPDGSGYPEQGKVDFISFRINPTTDSVTVRAVFPNKHIGSGDYDLIPGQYAPVRLILGENPDALLIPETALVETQAGTHVFVVGKDNKVESRKVVAGSSYKQQRVINEGLKLGESVIIEGVQKVRPGMAVKPEAASPPKT